MTSSDTQKSKSFIPWLYFFSTVAQMCTTTIAGSFISYYITERMLISALTMGAIMLVARAIDLVIGLAVGVFVQKVSFKHGQYRTWLLWAPVIVGVGTTLLFVNPNIPLWAKSVQILIGYIGYGGGMSLLQISQNGMLAKISGTDMNMRINISSKLVQGQNFSRILLSLITLPLIELIGKTGADGYTVMQIIFAVFGVSGQMCLFIGTKRFESYDPNFKSSGGASVKMSKMIGDSLRNNQLLILVLADTLRYTVQMTIANFNVYYFEYAARNINLMTIAMTAFSVVSLMGAFIAQPIAKRIGKRNSAILSGIICVASYTSLALFAKSNYILYTIFTSLGSMGAMIITACGVNLYLDCAEYQLYTTKTDNKTFIMSLLGVTIKLGFVFASIVVSGILEWSGYDNIAHTVANVPRLSTLIGAIPAVLYLGYLLIMIFAYKLTDEKSNEYARLNAEAAKTQAA